MPATGTPATDQGLWALLLVVFVVGVPEGTSSIEFAQLYPETLLAEAARAFNDALPLTGVVLTKTDGDAVKIIICKR